MAEHPEQEHTEPQTLSPLAQWNAVVQALLDQGLGTLTAYETAHALYPALWYAATADAAARRAARTGTGTCSFTHAYSPLTKAAYGKKVR